MPETGDGARGSQDLVGSTLAVVAGSVAALVGTLLARVIMARALAPAELGMLLLAVALASALGGIASLGLNPATAHRVAALRAAGAEEEAQASARTALLVAAAVGGGAAVALAAAGLAMVEAAGLLPPAWGLLGWGLLGVWPVALALPVGLAVLGACRGFGEVAGRALLRDGGGGLLRAAAVALAALAGGSVLVFALAFAAGSVAAEGLFALHAVRRGWFGRGRRRRDRGLVGSLRPFAVLEVLGQTDQWLDMGVVGLLASPAQVGFYGIAKGLLRALRMLGAAGAHGYLPMASAAHRRGDERALAGAYHHARLLTLALVWLPLSMCLAVPQQLVVLLAGVPYLPAGEVLRVLALSFLAESLLGYQDLTLVAAGHARTVALLRTGVLVAGGAAMALLTVCFGALGTAAGLALAVVGRLVVLALLLRRRVRLGGFGASAPGVVATALVLVGAAAVAGRELPGSWSAVAAAAAGGLGAALLWHRSGGSLGQLLRARRG